jgi:hypothetical protein
MTRAFAILALACSALSCDDPGGADTISQELLVPTGPTRPLHGVCSLEARGFTPDVSNQYFPLPVGRRMTLRGVDPDGTRIRVEMQVLDGVEQVAGVPARVVEARELEDGELVELVHDFYAQAPDGTVCYFGEDVDEIEDGQVVGHAGTWRAGQGGAEPGIIMPAAARLRPGSQFAQERAPGVAEDQSAVVAVGVDVSVPAGDFSDAAFLLDWNPLEGETIVNGEHKVYAPGVGLIIDDTVELESFQ